MGLLSQIFTWWDGQTLGTRIFTSRHGEKVGEDESGNVFYQSKGGERRWVIYNGEIEASKISPEWHGWLHHTYQDPPTITPLPHKPWEKEHKPNLTGTALAYHPPGSILSRQPAREPDYVAWQPE
jgi:NADH:ubiquinone oxidoreductase subunit